MIQAIADTHTMIWYLFADPRLSANAKATIDRAETHGDQIGVSSITMVEVVYLAEKGQIDAHTLAGVLAELDRSDPTFVEVSVDRYVAQAMQQVSRTMVPDMPDRIIAATAVAAGVPVITRDGKITRSNVPTIW